MSETHTSPTCPACGDQMHHCSYEDNRHWYECRGCYRSSPIRDSAESALDICNRTMAMEVTFSAIKAEIARGEAKIGGRPFASLHEAYAVLLEEVDELKEECWRREDSRSINAIETEAIQIAAIAVRIAEQFGVRK